MNNDISSSPMPKKIPTHFSEILEEEFNSRKARNAQYSLRSFARDLELSSGNLTDIIKRKVALSQERAQRISDILDFEKEERDFFCKLVKDNKTFGGDALKNYAFDTPYTTLSDDCYSVLSSWNYLAIVELVKVKDFQNDPEWIANRMGITREEAEDAISKLLRVGLLTKVDNELKQTYDLFVSPSGTPSDSAKKLHKEVSIKAMKALGEQHIEERDFSSGFLRVRKVDMPLVQKRIKEFRRNLMSELEAGDDHDSVYSFAIQFFRADKN